MSIDSVRYHAGIVIEHLRANDLASTAAEIGRATAELSKETHVEQVLNLLITYSNVSALGEAPITTLTLEGWLKTLGRLDRACRRTLKERGQPVQDDFGSRRGNIDPERPIAETITIPPPMGAGAYVSAAVAALGQPSARFDASRFIDTSDDGETAALRHFIAAGAFVLVMMATVVFILTVYRVPNLWTFVQAAAIERSADPPAVRIRDALNRNADIAV